MVKQIKNIILNVNTVCASKNGSNYISICALAKRLNLNSGKYPAEIIVNFLNDKGISITKSGTWYTCERKYIRMIVEYFYPQELIQAINEIKEDQNPQIIDIEYSKETNKYGKQLEKYYKITKYSNKTINKTEISRAQYFDEFLCKLGGN